MDALDGALEQGRTDIADVLAAWNKDGHSA
jgi:hypothetical protein